MMVRRRKKRRRPLFYSPKEAVFAVESIIRDSKNSALVLEGTSDYRFWSRSKHDKCDLVPIATYKKPQYPDEEKWFNRDAVVEVIEGYYSGGKWRKGGAAGIIDQDYANTESSAEYPQHLVTTAPHCDLENILFHNDASAKWMTNRLEELGKNPHEILRHAFQIATKIGILRRLNSTEKLYLKFNIDESQNDQDWLTSLIESNDIEKMIEIIVNNSTGKAKAKDIIKKFHIESSGLNSDGLSSVELANGHDINRILVALLELKHPREAEFWVRDNLSLEDISDTQIIKKIRDWEQSNPPHKVILDLEKDD